MEISYGPCDTGEPLEFGNFHSLSGLVDKTHKRS